MARSKRQPPAIIIDPPMNAVAAIELAVREKRTVILWRREHLIEDLVAAGGKATDMGEHTMVRSNDWTIQLLHVAAATGKDA